MDTIVVVAASAALIAWINWYFFFANKGAAMAATEMNGVQEVTIGVEGGYSPQTVQLASGRPVRLVFHRTETSSCSEEVVIPDFGIRRFLPAQEKTVIEFTPDRSGTFGFACGMGMLRGKLVIS